MVEDHDTYCISVDNRYDNGTKWTGNINKEYGMQLFNVISDAISEWNNQAGDYNLLKKLCDDAAQTVPGYTHVFI